MNQLISELRDHNLINQLTSRLINLSMNRLREKYQTELKDKLKEEFSISNPLAVPKLWKVVINIGIADAKDDSSVLEKAKNNLALIAGQQPVVTKAKKSIAAFKLTAGASIGLMVTLRGEKMYAFLDKLINIVLPRVRDFRGISAASFDKTGNLNLGLKEQAIFPETDYKYIDKQRGLQITISTTAQNPEQGKKLLELLGMPFRQGTHG